MDKDVVIFNTQTGGIEVAIDISHDTVWLDKNDIAKLFSVDRSGISRHINNIFISSSKIIVLQMETNA